MPPHYTTLAWKIHGRRSLVGYSPWGHKESDMTEQLHFLSFFLYPLSSKRMPETVSSILVLEMMFRFLVFFFYLSVCFSNPIILSVIVVMLGIQPMPPAVEGWSLNQ